MADAIQQDDLPPGYFIDRFEVIKTLGRGGFGITYLAHDHDLNTEVAIKEFFPFGKAIRGENYSILLRSADDIENYGNQLNRFIEEARALAQFRHTNIVQVRRLIESLNDTAYFVMDFVRGGTLGEYIEKNGALSPAASMALIRSVASGMIAVHNSGVIHRDIKPDNILLDASSPLAATTEQTGFKTKELTDVGCPILIDFGAARQTTDSRSATNYVSMGFAPIEQYTSRSTPDVRSDIYALGAVAYSCLTARVPTDANARQLDPTLHKTVESELRGKAPESFLRAIDRAMSIMPGDRQDTMSDFILEMTGKKELPEFNQGSASAPQYGSSQPHRAGKHKSGSIIPLVSAAAVFAIVLGGVGYGAYSMGLFEPAPTPEPTFATEMISAPAGEWTTLSFEDKLVVSLTTDAPFRLRTEDATYLLDNGKSLDLSGMGLRSVEVKPVADTLSFALVTQDLPETD